MALRNFWRENFERLGKLGILLLGFPEIHFLLIMHLKVNRHLSLRCVAGFGEPDSQ